jgi:hypothetical protein
MEHVTLECENQLAKEVSEFKLFAKDLRRLLKSMGGVFSVRTSRQWERVKTEPRLVMYVQGAFPFELNFSERERSLHFLLEALCEGRGLKLCKGVACSWTIIKEL